MDIVLIVGASSGIGYACAKKFLSEGYGVVNISRTECVLAGVRNYCCDVSDEGGLIKILKAVIAENPSIRYLVYCAGASMACPLEHVDPSDYRYLFEVNYFGFLTCLKALLPLLRQSGGTACVIGSVAALSPIPFDSYYDSSKAALNAFCAAMQTETYSRGVRVICVMPGGTRTNFSYKRKVYPEEAVGDYALAMKKAVDKLQKTEQTGQRAERVANLVFRRCTQGGGRYLFVSGLKNKMITAAVKRMPQAILTAITGAYFFSSEEDV